MSRALRVFGPLTRGRRFVAQIVLLVVLYLISLPNPELFSNVIIVIILFGYPVSSSVALLLIWTSRQAPDIESLRERADDAVTLWLMHTAAVIIAVLVILSRAGITFPGRPTLAVLAWLILLILVPTIGWLQTWQKFWLPVIRRRRAERTGQEGGS